MEKIENKYNETWLKVEDEGFVKKIKDCFNEVDKEDGFWVYTVAEVVANEIGEEIPNEYQNKHWVIECHMGRNGSGEWINYFKDIQTVLEKLNEKFERVYLIDWECDCADDVSYPLIGVSNERK